MSRSIYVASSWRNEIQQEVVRALREQGHDVYDFRNPPGDSPGFAWRQVRPGGDPNAPYDRQAVRKKGTDWVPAEEYLQMIAHPRAEEGFRSDRRGMELADTMVMVLPCGKSAHLEIGWAMGRGLDTAILLEDPVEPELMYKFAKFITPSMHELLIWLNS